MLTLVGLTSAQVHLCAAAVRVAVNPALVHSSGRVDRATVGRVGPGCPHDHPADMRHREGMGRHGSLQLVAECTVERNMLSTVTGNYQICWEIVQFCMQSITSLESLAILIQENKIKREGGKRSTHC